MSVSSLEPSSAKVADRRSARGQALAVEGKPRAAGQRRWWLMLAGCVLAAFAAIGADRVPPDTTRELNLSGEAVAESLPGPRFRIGTYNIHGGKGREGASRDLSRTRDTLAEVQCDIVGLNEVHGYLWPRSPRNQAAALGEQLGLAAAFAPTERRYWHGHFGNALLSRVACSPIHVTLLPCSQGFGFRNCVLTRAEISGVPVSILATHVDRVEDRPVQLRHALDLFLSLQPPAVLIGDLNCDIDDPQLAALMQQPDVVDAVAAGGAELPARRIDWIFTRGLQVVGSGVLDHGASDHPLMWAELEVVPLRAASDAPQSLPASVSH